MKPFEEFLRRTRDRFPGERLTTDPLGTFAKGGDASFYRLVPRLVVTVRDESEVSFLCREAKAAGVPLTFRAGGTSLSGQAITDSVLVELGPHWRGADIGPGGEWIRLDPGLTGAQANRLLAPYGRKIGPDPASIDAAMIGGIAANNASGMCCGVKENSYHTLESLRAVFADGSILDTGDRASREPWAASHAPWIAGIRNLMDRAREPGLAEKIRRKYRIKNTTGYGLNSFLDFDDPLEVIAHLLIGSEGTLGFLSSVRYRTVMDHPHKACILLFYPSMGDVIRTVVEMDGQPVSSAELLDYPALMAVKGMPGIPAMLETLAPGSAALLVETRAPDEKILEAQVATLHGRFAGHAGLVTEGFTRDPEQIAALWKVRKGAFPAVGARRPVGSTVIIEDVAFPMEHLDSGIRGIQQLMADFGYGDGVIFGHALAGNIHFVFSQSFTEEGAIRQYEGFMEAVAELVLAKAGSLKAEHGTGRNMAPFVGREWGPDGLSLMRDLKDLLDPEGILNPGVILTQDPRGHLKNLKPMPAADPLVDACIECGFCEPKCPSRHHTLTPRQRIAAYREMGRLTASGEDGGRLRSLAKAFAHDGVDTCAADGLCATACPVGIDTGKLTVKLRERSRTPVGRAVAGVVARNFSAIARVARLGTSIVPGLPGASRVPDEGGDGDPVVYFPSCMSRTLGSESSSIHRSTPQTIFELLARAGLRPVLPENTGNLCCGKAFESKGFPREAARKGEELSTAIAAATRGGSIPLLIDTSPCSLHFPTDAFPIRFAEMHLIPRLTLRPLEEPVVFHIPCSDRKAGLEKAWHRVAPLLSKDPIFPTDTDCCAFAGDRGFTHPALNASALRFLKDQVPGNCRLGVSTSRGCEIGLTRNGGRPFHHLFELMARCVVEPPGRFPGAT